MSADRIPVSDGAQPHRCTLRTQRRERSLLSGRPDVVERIANLVGPEVLEVTDVRTGWPAHADLVVDGAPRAVDVYAGPVGLSQRGRDAVERRFQNPGAHRPITPIQGRELLLLGLWETDDKLDVKRPVLVMADASRRIGRVTRFSVFVSLAALLTASAEGWAESATGSDEIIRCFTPALLPVSYLARRSAVTPELEAMQAAVAASGLHDQPGSRDPSSGERARRATTSLVRDAAFSRRVIAAYGGECAMCGIAGDLTQGAHIYPASAPVSPDEPWNGLALCANHHVAFDRHLVGVQPASLEISVHPSLIDGSARNSALRWWIDSTLTHLRRPGDAFAAPRREMFMKRYAFYGDPCAWLLR